MKVAGINSSVSYIAPVKKPVFNGIFGAPNLSERFRYGIEALDNNSLLVVTSNPERADMTLEQYSNKIVTPILKKYTLKVEESDLKNKEEIDSDFAIFKQDKKYFALVLGSGIFSSLMIKRPKDELKSKEHLFKTGAIVELHDGVELGTGEMLWREEPKLLFKPPYKFNTLNAEKYLQVRTINNIADFNRRSIASLSAKNLSKADKKGFTFADVGGLDDVIEQLRKYVVRPVNYPQVFENIRLNKGIMLYGPPRCGKTLLGKALANEVGAKYNEYNANEFKSSHVGASESAIRDMFKKAAVNAPSITFIDEFDSIGKTRDGSSNARFDDPMVNQFLGCMSDLEKSKVPAFIIAATNMIKLIDPALLASGRFGLHLEVPMPNLEGLKQIFNIHSKNQPIQSDVSVENLIQKMFAGKFNGSDVAEMISDAYFNALERLGMFAKMDAKKFSYDDLKSISISFADFEKAIGRILKQKL